MLCCPQQGHLNLSSYPRYAVALLHVVRSACLQMCLPLGTHYSWKLSQTVESKSRVAAAVAAACVAQQAAELHLSWHAEHTAELNTVSTATTTLLCTGSGGAALRLPFPERAAVSWETEHSRALAFYILCFGGPYLWSCKEMLC